ncbi:MAG: hypothetical protein ACJAVK_001559, partial [Akkermansiaceae bacterium]
MNLKFLLLLRANHWLPSPDYSPSTRSAPENT